MKLTEEKLEAINKRMKNIHSTIVLTNGIGEVKLKVENSGFCFYDLADLGDLIRYLECLKDVVENETGIIL